MELDVSLPKFEFGARIRYLQFGTGSARDRLYQYLPPENRYCFYNDYPADKFDLIVLTLHQEDGNPKNAEWAKIYAEKLAKYLADGYTKVQEKQSIDLSQTPHKTDIFTALIKPKAPSAPSGGVGTGIGEGGEAVTPQTNPMWRTMQDFRNYLATVYLDSDLKIQTREQAEIEARDFPLNTYGWTLVFGSVTIDGVEYSVFIRRRRI